MHDTIHLNTDAITEAELRSIDNRGICNKYSINYAKAHDDVLLKVAEINGSIHCWAYDRGRDVTIDVSAKGESEDAIDGAWDGDNNPNIDDKCRWGAEFESIDAFKDEFYGTHSPFYQ